MKLLYTILVLLFFLSACTSQKQLAEQKSDISAEQLDISAMEKKAFSGKEAKGDTVTISDDQTQYRIIIIDPGYYSWLHSIAMPEGYYSQEFMETRNRIYVMNWNQRAMNPFAYDPSLYEMQIDYDAGIDYGYEVNYKLYNYFIYFQRKYNQRLGPFFPRIR